MRNKKILTLLLIGLMFINAGIPEDAEINITAQRADQSNLVISWSIKNIDNVNDVRMEILFDNPPEGLIQNPLVIDDITQDELTSSRTIEWLGDSKLTVKLIISTINFVQYTGEDCNHTFCLKESIEEFESEEFLIDEVPNLPVVPTTLAEIVDTQNETTSTQTITNGNIEFTNELITTIPIFSDIDFSDQQKNAFAFGITSMIIFLFYGVLLAQEWFNRIISHYRVKWTKKETILKQKTKLETIMEISLIALITSLIYAFVEEGFTFSVEPQNLAIFLGVLFGLAVVTFFYEGIESLIEYFIYDQKARFSWNPQAMFFAILSTVLFIVIDLPFGFILGFIASIHIVTKREQADLSPKFFSMISLAIVGYAFFYATSFDEVSSSGVLMAICKLTYLMCLEGVIFKAVPWGGNELFDAIGDSKGLNQAMPVVSFLISVWLFIRILVLPPDSEFNALQQTLLQSGALAFRFALVLLVYITIIIILGNFMKKYAELNRPVHYNGDDILSDDEIKDIIEEELEDSIR
jgi:hypothetical protein|tara:strand:+ start:3312 stop:4880 length:1569 start_codon:yes stop_codon:yes gene_type:complete